MIYTGKQQQEEEWIRLWATNQFKTRRIDKKTKKKKLI